MQATRTTSASGLSASSMTKATHEVVMLLGLRGPPSGRDGRASHAPGIWDGLQRGGSGGSGNMLRGHQGEVGGYRHVHLEWERTARPSASPHRLEDYFGG